MFKHYLTIALRNLVKNKLYSIINIVGLAVGLAACLLIMLFVRDEFSYDTFWPDAERIYRLQIAYNNPGRTDPIVTTQAPGPAKDAIKRYFPEDIQHSTRILGLSPIVKQGNRVFTESIHWVDPEFIDIFTLDVLAGDIRATLTNINRLAISESFARKYFGEENPVGKTVYLSSFFERDYRIGAVFKDLPHNTTLAFQALTKLDENSLKEQVWTFENWTGFSGHTFFTLKKDASIENINSQLDNFVDNNFPTKNVPDELETTEWVVFSTLALKDIQLKSKGKWGMKPTGNLATVIILVTIAGLILLSACINFINLTTARSLQRAREVVLRKVLGAKRHQLICQFMGESILAALAGLLLGLVLMEISMPAYCSFLDRSLAFHYSDGQTIVILLGLAVSVGLLGGIYPALVLSGFLPSLVLKANKTTETESSALLRKTLVTLQFSVSIFLVITTCVVYGQMLHATRMDPGFDKNNMLTLYNMIRPEVLEKQNILKERIALLPGIINIAYSSDHPSSTTENNRSISMPDKPNLGDILLGIQSIGHDFLTTYEIPLLAGRNYNKEFATDGIPIIPEGHNGSLLEGTVLINESAAAAFGYNSPNAIIGRSIRINLGESLNGAVQANLAIIGVIPDVHFRSLREEIQSEIYLLPIPRYNYGVLTVRFRGDALPLIQQLEQLWKNMFPNTPFTYKFVDEVMAVEFEKEQTLATLLGLFSLLAVTIAGLGLYGLATFTAERRTREIGIRKVLGAGIIDITRLMLWQFSKPVVAAILIASPIATWATIYWLDTFPYRLDAWLLIPICLITSFIILAITCVIVGSNTVKVARENPITALRYE
jgi:putative ABC transport system permease protein